MGILYFMANITVVLAERDQTLDLGPTFVFSPFP